MKSLFSIVFFLLGVVIWGQALPSYSLKDIDHYKGNAHFIVEDKESLLKAFIDSKPYDIIYIKGNISINLSGKKNIEIKEGIKLIGDRNTKNKIKGAIIYTKKYGVRPFFNIIGDNVLISGLTIKGDDGNVLIKEDAFKGKASDYIKKNYLDLYHKNMHATPVSSGIATKMNNLVIHNCELYQWTYTAVYIQKGAKNIHIVNSYIHHNQRFGLGYGVTVDQGEAFIRNNVFNYNRHSVASTGREYSKYTVENNVIYQGGNNTWAIDMHGGKDRNDGTDLAGEYIIVKNNTFYLSGKGKAVVIRGRSDKTSVIEKNIIHLDKSSSISGEKVFEQVNRKGNLEIKNNLIKFN